MQSKVTEFKQAAEALKPLHAAAQAMIDARLQEIRTNAATKAARALKALVNLDIEAPKGWEITFSEFKVGQIRHEFRSKGSTILGCAFEVPEQFRSKTLHAIFYAWRSGATADSVNWPSDAELPTLIGYGQACKWLRYLAPATAEKLERDDMQRGTEIAQLSADRTYLESFPL